MLFEFEVDPSLNKPPCVGFFRLLLSLRFNPDGNGSVHFLCLFSLLKSDTCMLLYFTEQEYLQIRCCCF